MVLIIPQPDPGSALVFAALIFVLFREGLPLTYLWIALLLIIIFSGYENFVSKIAFGEHEDRPVWMGKVGFSDLKLKLIGAIVAISAVELLKAFINAQELSTEIMAWKVGIHLTFVVSGVLFALTDWIVAKKGQEH